MPLDRTGELVANGSPRCGEPQDPPKGDAGEEGLEHHLVEARLGEVRGRVGVLAGDRLEQGLDRRPARLGVHTAAAWHEYTAGARPVGA